PPAAPSPAAAGPRQLGAPALEPGGVLLVKARERLCRAPALMPTTACPDAPDHLTRLAGITASRMQDLLRLDGVLSQVGREALEPEAYINCVPRPNARTRQVQRLQLADKSISGQARRAQPGRQFRDRPITGSVLVLGTQLPGHGHWLVLGACHRPAGIHKEAELGFDHVPHHLP